MTVFEELHNAATLALTDPKGAAAKLLILADRLRDLATQLVQLNDVPFRAPGGMDDRVLAKVIGPNGTVKQTIDTGEIT